MNIHDGNVKMMETDLTEIRDNTPAIYEDDCQMYYKLLTRAIAILKREPIPDDKCIECPENNKMCMYHEKR